MCGSIKYRGAKFRGGYHDFTIRTGGLDVFPRLVASEHRRRVSTAARMSSGIAELDQLLGGGVERGSSTLILGPAGTGKSLLAHRISSLPRSRAARRRRCSCSTKSSACCSTAEGLASTSRPCAQPAISSSSRWMPPNCRPASSPTASASGSRGQVKTVVIDSLNGYQAAMPEENSLILHMHELLQYLNRQGAATFMTVAQHGLVGDMKAPVDVTYLADTVILLRYFEAIGSVRRAISVIKKRTGAHEVDDPRISHRQPRPDHRRAARRIPGRAARRSGLCRRGQAPAGGAETA